MIPAALEAQRQKELSDPHGEPLGYIREGVLNHLLAAENCCRQSVSVLFSSSCSESLRSLVLGKIPSPRNPAGRKTLANSKDWAADCFREGGFCNWPLSTGSTVRA
jgi:hypothetical protein